MPQQLLISKLLRVKSAGFPISFNTEAVNHFHRRTATVGNVFLNHFVYSSVVCNRSHISAETLILKVDWVGLFSIFICILCLLIFDRIVCRVNADKFLDKILLVLELILCVNDEVFHLLAAEVMWDVSVELSAEILQQVGLFIVNSLFDLAENLIALLYSLLTEVA